MADPDRPRNRSDFEIAIICALDIEATAVEAMFDVFWQGENSFGKVAGDPNAYTTGRIGRHNVVLAYLPAMGKGASANVAGSFRSSFNNIKLGLVVGTCGGVPSEAEGDEEMLLGDVVISTGVVQYDYGRQYSNRAVKKDTLEENLGRPSEEIRAFLRKIKTLRNTEQLKDDSFKYLTTFCGKDRFRKWGYPGVNEDVLYPSSYRHKHRQVGDCTRCTNCKSEKDDVCEEALDSSCEALNCDTREQMTRERKMKTIQGDQSTRTTAARPEIFFGRIASGDMVNKSAYHRDTIAKEWEVIAFEMEGAGVWERLPTVLIKGVCNYADSHKNKTWLKYAAASAAACVKAFLNQWEESDKAGVTTPWDFRGSIIKYPV